VAAPAPAAAATLPPFVLDLPAPETPSAPPPRPSAVPPTPVTAVSELSSLRAPSGPSHRDKPTQVPAANRVGTGYESLVGQIIGGRYRVLSLFAQGTSTLLMASDIRRGNMVLIRPERDLVGGVRKGVKPTFVVNNIAFYMSNISLGGLNLRNFIGTVGLMPPVQIIEYGLRLCMEAKKRGLLLGTRYWSPETLTVDEAGHLAVVAAPDSMDKQARPGVFSPPEQAAGGPLDERSDVYLIGAILFFLATGMPPPAPDRMPTPEPHLDSKGRPVAGVVEAHFPLFPNLDPRLGGVLATALQGEPGLRYRSVEQLSGALTGLAAAMKGQEVKALPTKRGAAGERAGGNALVRVLALLGLAVVGAVIIYLLIVADSALNLGTLFSGPVRTLPPATATEVAVIVPPATETPPPGEATATVNAAFAPPVAASLDRVTVVQVDAQHYPQIDVYCSVVSADGRPVVNLPPNQWTITNNGEPVQGFAYVDLSSQPAPISTFLVMDVSGKMAGAPLEQAKAAITQFVDAGQPGDSLGLATFNDTAQVVQPFTVGRERVKTGIAGLEAKGGVALWDALNLALQQTSQESGRRALVLLSAGPDTASKATAEAVLTATQRSGVPIFVVSLASDGFDPQTLAPLAQQTGGALLTAADPTALPGLYQQVGNRLTAQYRISFTATTPLDKQARTLNVGVTVEEKNVRDTRQYFVR
jgi:VWFA-related protein